ncbi:heptaprenyl diphosphate synthase component 1 [Laceyella putida]|uniref:Heptaprenyl diphosphate synthase component 1 n=1 Tax=Laceyella putida TaxID=110101 RepID=A0ABW2RMG5_9BACL
MSSIHNDELKWILNTIDGLTTHSYVKQMIGRPTIPVFFVRVLRLMLKSLHVPEERARLYTVAVTLLDMGQVMHETVSIQSQTDPDEHRKQQLYVLTGDYFSSVFYQQLAKHQEMKGISYLSQAVSRMNEKKMTYHMAQGTFASKVEEWEMLREISGGLLAALADFFHVDLEKPTVWRNIVMDLMVLYDVKCGWDSFETEAEVEWIKNTSERLNKASAELADPPIQNELNILISEAMPFT